MELYKLCSKISWGCPLSFHHIIKNFSTVVEGHAFSKGQFRTLYFIYAFQSHRLLIAWTSWKWSLSDQSGSLCMIPFQSNSTPDFKVKPSIVDHDAQVAHCRRCLSQLASPVINLFKNNSILFRFGFFGLLIHVVLCVSNNVIRWNVPIFLNFLEHCIDNYKRLADQTREKASKLLGYIDNSPRCLPQHLPDCHKRRRA